MQKWILIRIISNIVECLIFARTLLRKFREAPWIRQNKTRQIKYLYTKIERQM